MKTTSSLVAAAAALLLNAALIFTALTGLSSKVKPDKRPPPIVVRLLSAPEPVPSAPAPQAKLPEARPEQKHIKRKPRQKPQAAPRQSPQAREAPKAQDTQTQPPAEPPQTPTEPSTTSIAPQASMDTSGASSTATSSVPEAAKTEVSIASYASSNQTPPYPRLSRLNEEQGTVVLRVLVKPDGTAGAVEIKTSSGFELLDESAKSTVQSWRFNPATVNGKPVAEWYQVPIPFTLRDK